MFFHFTLHLFIQTRIKLELNFLKKADLFLDSYQWIEKSNSHKNSNGFIVIFFHLRLYTNICFFTFIHADKKKLWTIN